MHRLSRCTIEDEKCDIRNSLYRDGFHLSNQKSFAIIKKERFAIMKKKSFAIINMQDFSTENFEKCKCNRKT